MTGDHTTLEPVRTGTPATIDHTAYPHIIDAIVEYADHNTRLAFRALSREYRDRIGRAMLKRVVIGFHHPPTDVEMPTIRWRSFDRPNSRIPNVFSTTVARVGNARPASIGLSTRAVMIEPFHTVHQLDVASSYIAHLSNTEVLFIRPGSSAYWDHQLPPLDYPPRVHTIVMLLPISGVEWISDHFIDYIGLSVTRLVAQFRYHSKDDRFHDIPFRCDFTHHAHTTLVLLFGPASPGEAPDWPERNARNALQALLIYRWREILVVGLETTVDSFIEDACGVSRGPSEYPNYYYTYEEVAERVKIMSRDQYNKEGGVEWPW